MISSLSAWVMSIAGVICLSVLVELVLPNGQMNKYVKGIFSFVIILIIISPVPSLLDKSFSLDGLFDQPQIEVQENYLYQVNVNKVSSMQKDIIAECENLGYQNVDARIDCDIFAKKIEIKAVYVDLSRLVIMDKASHKDMISIKTDILQIATSIVNIQKERVVFNE